MHSWMQTPCDKAVMQSAGTAVTCNPGARAWILAATILASSMAFVDSTAVNVALPALQGSFHSTVADVQWVVESYGVFLAALILVGGSLGDLWGRRFVFTIGVVIFALASVGCGFAANVYQLIVARSVQGVGAALLVPGSLAIISTSFDESSRGKAIGTWSGFTAITAAIGPVLGGWLVEHASWRWVFFINLPLALAVICISLWQIPESRRDTADRVDWSGAILATVGLGGLVYGLIESINLGWRNPLVFGSTIVGFCCVVAFVFLEAHLRAPMLPLKLLRSRSFTGTNLLTLFLYVAVGIFFFLFPLNLIQVQDYSATAAGAAMLPFILLMFSLSRWSGGLVVPLWPKKPIDHWAPGSCPRFRSVGRPRHRRELLADLLPRSDRSGLRNGRNRSTADYGRYEFSRSRPGRHSIWNQQRGGARSIRRGYRSTRNCDGEGL